MKDILKENKIRVHVYEQLTKGTTRPLKDAAAHNDDIELRVEIMDALMAEGKARHVAADLTSTPAKMTAEGRRLGIL